MVSEVILIKAERLILTLQHKGNWDSEFILFKPICKVDDNNYFVE